MKCSACNTSVVTLTEYIRTLTVEKDMYVLRYIIHCIITMSYKEYRTHNGILSRCYDSWYVCRNGHLNVDIIDDYATLYTYTSRRTRLFMNLTHVGLVLGTYNYGKLLVTDKTSYVFAFDSDCIEHYSTASSFREDYELTGDVDTFMDRLEEVVIGRITLSTYEVPRGLNFNSVRGAICMDGPYSFSCVSELMSSTRGALMW